MTENTNESPTYIAYGERREDDCLVGIAVLVDGHYVMDGRLQLALEVYELTGGGDASCSSEQEVKDALMALGARESSAAGTAKRLWLASGVDGSEA
jgi:hypothetical protein